MAVVPIGVAPKPALEVDQAVIKELETLLESAKTGEFQGIGYFLIRHDHSIDYTTSVQRLIGNGIYANGLSSVGAASLLYQRMLNSKLRSDDTFLNKK